MMRRRSIERSSEHCEASREQEQKKNVVLIDAYKQKKHGRVHPAYCNRKCCSHVDEHISRSVLQGHEKKKLHAYDIMANTRASMANCKKKNSCSRISIAFR